MKVKKKLLEIPSCSEDSEDL